MICWRCIVNRIKIFFGIPIIEPEAVPIFHKHLIVRAEVRKPPQASDMRNMEVWFKTLIKDLNMKLLNGPHFEYVHMKGNKGFTGVSIIETSHIAIHVWDEPDPALVQLDVYTCGELDPQIVFNALKDFEPVKIAYKYLDREHDLTELDKGSFSVS